MRRIFALIVLLLAATPWVRGADEPPPRDIRLEEKKFEQLSNQDADPLAATALAIDPTKWKHAETDHFILHYRHATEAQKVVREIEYDLWFVAKFLGASKERYANKSHVYIFKDEPEWKKFLSKTDCPPWCSSFAHGDELFLHVGGIGEGFDSQTLAHETTHAVVARLYPNRQWPHWLNEGFAEYMSGASVAARKVLWAKGLQKDLSKGTLPLEQLTTTKNYPSDREAVHQFYQSSEKLVRYLMDNFPKDRFPQFIDAILGGARFQDALLQIYGDKIKDYLTFSRRYERFTK